MLTWPLLTGNKAQKDTFKIIVKTTRGNWFQGVAQHYFGPVVSHVTFHCQLCTLKVKDPSET